MFVSYVYTCTVFALKKEQSLNSTDLSLLFPKTKAHQAQGLGKVGRPPTASGPSLSQHHRIAILHDPPSTPSQLFFLDPDNEMHKNLISSGNKRCRRKRLPQLPRRCPGAPGRVTGAGGGEPPPRGHPTPPRFLFAAPPKNPGKPTPEQFIKRLL